MPIPWIPKTPEERAQAIIEKERPTVQQTWEIQQTPTYSEESYSPTPYIEKSAPKQTFSTGYNWQQPTQQVPQVDEEAARAETIRTYLQEIRDLESVKNPDIATLETTEEATPDTPFWLRALQVFSAPFEWVQSNVINPALSIGLDAAIPNLEREEGEDYFDWKRREWDNWKTAGIKLGSWNIDVKGVLEFAPWLLIPGAGGVGTKIFTKGLQAVTKEAAKQLAKEGVKVITQGGKQYIYQKGTLASAARAVGNAVRYSPWGLVEKGTGAIANKAISKLGKGAEQIQEAVSNRLFGEIEPGVAEPAINKFTSVFKEHINPLLKEKEVAIKQIDKVRNAKLAQLEADRLAGKISDDEFAKLGNEIKSGKYESPLVPKETLNKIEPGDIKIVRHRIVTSPELNVDERISAVNAFDELMTGYSGKEAGVLPYTGEIKLFAKALGRDFADAVGEFVKQPQSKLDKIIDALNIPSATLASFDLSGTLRQGFILSLMYPKRVPRAFLNQIRAMTSEKWALQADDVLRSNPLYGNAKRFGVDFEDFTKGSPLASKNEAFMSNLAEKLPFVRRSQRGMSVFLNDLRMGAFESVHPVFKAMGATDEQLYGVAKFINAASGRGDLSLMGRDFNQFAPMLNALMFSPRLQLSRLQLIGSLTSSNPYVRKMAANGIVRFIGAGASILGLFEMTGAGTVELDPRSSDFAKLKIGDTRYDIWTGYAQYARLMAQMVTGEGKSVTGNIMAKDRMDTLVRFSQSKGSPATSLILDLLRGENYEGEPLFTDTTGALKQAEERLTPLLLQSMIEAAELGGFNSALMTLPEGLGIGVITYGNEVQKVKNKIARSMGLKDWDEIDPATQKKIMSSSNELKSAIKVYEERMMGTQWGDWRLAGNAIEEQFSLDIELASLEYRETGDGYAFREKVNKAFAGRTTAFNARSKDVRFKEIVDIMEKPKTDAELLELTPEQMAIRAYQEALYNKDMFDAYGNYRFDEAERVKAELRKVLGEELYNYIEEYNGLKYEDLPAEYQDLVIARQILEPYWSVEQEADKYFKRESIAKERFIARRRKIMRRVNKDIDYYYRKYYLRSE